MKFYLKSSVVFQLWELLARRRKQQILVVIGLMLFVSFTEALSIGSIVPFLTVLTSPEKFLNYPFAQKIFSEFQFNNNHNLVLLITIFFSLIIIVAGISRIILLWAQTQLSSAISRDLSVQVYERTLNQSYEVYLSRNSSEILAGIQKTNALISNLILPVMIIVSSIFLIISVVCMLIVIGSFIVFISIFSMFLIYITVIFFIKKNIHKNSKIISIQQGLVTKSVQEGLGGIRDILIDGSQSVYVKVYRNSLNLMLRASSNNQLFGSLPKIGIESIGIVIISFLAYFVIVKEYAEGRTTTDSIVILGTLALAIQKLLPLFQQVYSAYVRIRGNEASNIHALELLRQPLVHVTNSQSQFSLPFKQTISLINVSYRYQNSSKWVLKNLNLEIVKGSRVGITGITGSGKSTLFDIFMGLLQPIEGSIFIDDVMLTLQNKHNWQRQIAHVPQSIFLADSSIAENIAFGIPFKDIDMNRVKEAAKLACIAQTIEAWTNNYLTVVGERGVRLSGGQRQRIGLARALYKRADVILLDEATSALDNSTENEIIQMLDKIDKKITILVIAHRVTTLNNCNIVFELVNGKLQLRDDYEKKKSPGEVFIK
jgi:ATP-binding cassette subfamily B protein